MTTSRGQLDRMLERITTHLRAHAAELRRLQRAGAAPGELAERRAVIARLRGSLDRLVTTAVARRTPDSW
jgi:hypothetical protein